MRMIDADKLKQNLESLVVGGEKAIKETTSGNNWIDGIHTAYREIDEAPTVEGLQWIPCSERLPDKNGDYLVTMEGMCRPYIRKLGFSATSKTWGYGGVIAWMDVKPYKKEE